LENPVLGCFFPFVSSWFLNFFFFFFCSLSVSDAAALSVEGLLGQDSFNSGGEFPCVFFSSSSFIVYFDGFETQTRETKQAAVMASQLLVFFFSLLAEEPY